MRFFKNGRYVIAYTNEEIKYRKFIHTKTVMDFTIFEFNKINFKGYLL